MKKILILLLFVSSFGFAQHIEEHPQGDFFGKKLDYTVYRSPNNSTHWLVFFVGQGELSDGEGGNISKLYKFGFPKLVKAGYDFDFNILMIQPQKNYGTIHNTILPWIDEEFKPSKVIVSGISLGANECWSLMLFDRYKIITAMVSMSGRPLGGTDVVPNMITVPVYAYHGILDKKVNYGQAIKAFKAYDVLHPGMITIDLKPVGHTGWDEVMIYNGALHQWITNQFNSELK